MSRVSVTLTYPGATVDKVAAMLLTPSFRESVCAADKHALGAEVGLAGTTITIDQRQSVGNIPGFAKKFVGDELRIVQVERWNGARADVDVTIPGKPGQIRGTANLRQDGDTVVEQVELDVEVKIPLVGGKIATLIGDQLRDVLTNEQRLGRQWLEGEQR
ncbi:DUF2505 domain-containing protein [Nocardioides sp. Bht2]|uniref:DUF2505 domain-containing protein n=1 Tax=Nocardioides sp. Bht2 TaxID=3392297 RepID=UPI0039B5542E